MKSFIFLISGLFFLLTANAQAADKIKSKYVLKADEILVLPKNRQAEYFVELRKIFYNLEQKQKYTLQAGQSSQFQEFYVKLLKQLELLPAADASNEDAGSVCLYAGNFSVIVKENGRTFCKAPVSANCPKGQVQCNPTFYGTDYSDKALCVTTGNQASKRCNDASGKIYSHMSVAKKFESGNGKAEWDKQANQIESYCLDNSKRQSFMTEACTKLFEQIQKVRDWHDYTDKYKTQSEQCSKYPKVLNKKGYASPTGVEQRYIIKNDKPNEYEAVVNLQFKNANKRKSPLSSQATKYAQDCLKDYQKFLKGPGGQSLKITVGGPDSQLAPPIDIELVANSAHRSNSAQWKYNPNPTQQEIQAGYTEHKMNCDVVLHEVLHLLGLADEYVEDSMGFKVVEGQEGHVHVDSGAEFADFDCRVLGPKNSIMHYQWEAVSSVNSGERDSLLFPAQFNAIIKPECYDANRTYNNCARAAYTTTPVNVRSNNDRIGECKKLGLEGYDECAAKQDRGCWLGAPGCTRQAPGGSRGGRGFRGQGVIE